MKCPECGTEVVKPIKEWDLSPKVHVKMYEHCGKKFRETIKKDAKAPAKTVAKIPVKMPVKAPVKAPAKMPVKTPAKK